MVFLQYSNLPLHLALLILPSGNPVPEFSLSLPFLFIILFLSLFFCSKYLPVSFSTAQACVPAKNLLPSKGSNCSATLSSKSNKHTLKVPQYPLKSAVPTSKPQRNMPHAGHSSQRLSYSGNPPLRYSFFSPFFCHFITICTHHGEWTYIHAQTCMMGVGGFLFFFCIIFFPYSSLCGGKETKITVPELNTMILCGCRSILKSSVIFYLV